MKCPKCGIINDKSSAYCSECGAKLLQKSPAASDIYCETCGSKIPGDANFCPSCGRETGRNSTVKRKKANRKKNSPNRTAGKTVSRRRFPFSAIMIIVIAFFFGIILIVRQSNKTALQTNGNFLETGSLDPTLETKMMEVASNFYCACGSCVDTSLQTCSCAAAATERQFIRDALQQGQQLDEIIVAVNNRYGEAKETIDKNRGEL